MKYILVLAVFAVVSCVKPNPPVPDSKVFTIETKGIKVEGKMKDGAKISADVAKASLLIVVDILEKK